MPGGSTIIRYEGSRGVVWKYKLRDADGRHVKRTVGREADGVTRKDAEAAARSAVVAVESRGWWKPPPLTFEQYARTWFAQGERTAGWKPNTVFAHPEKGTALNSYRYADESRAALAAAGITDYVRPFHDARHGALTNLAAAGVSLPAIMGIAGHRSPATTKQYVHLAGVVFRDGATALEQRMLWLVPELVPRRRKRRS